MYTAERDIANQITRTLISKFAVDNDILPAHLLDTPEQLTPSEVLRAFRALDLAVLS